MSIPTLPEITAQTITTGRLTTRVLTAGDANGTAVLFLHGNLSSATWWEEVMVTLPAGYYAIAPDQRGYGEADPAALIEATQGLRDLAADAFALLDTMGITKAHLVGSSLGGVVVWRMLEMHPERILSIMQAAPGSPYGFGGTKDIDGTPCFDDYAGAGAGLINPAVVQAIQAGDRSLENPLGLRGALRRLVYNPPFIPAREEELLSSSLQLHIGAKAYPGDVAPSPNWPGFTAGLYGPNNALSPKYAGDVSQLWRAEIKPPILWLWGDKDLAVSNAAASDPANLGALGYIPNWPGPAVYPPQPMLDQTRAVLDKYAAHGGHYEEVKLEGVGHAPYIEALETFNKHLHTWLEKYASS
ncbi:MAG: alpha/beta hydrolase [Anaerolineales bacterium]|nr:alpha/beta hydrolase [Anaerolineales bacterium]